MSTKTFLTADDLTLAQGMLTQVPRVTSQQFSKFLGERLEARLSKHSLWRKSEPIALGSWSRDELSPKSDIDLLFAGPEVAVKELVTDFEKQGLKLRYRVPQDMNDWSKGVEAFDIIALLTARPFFEETTAQFEKQLDLIRRSVLQGKKNKQLIKAMVSERNDRNKRYDSINQFLEPNLKYGPGGLRDLEQALTVRRFFMAHTEPYLKASTTRAEKSLNERKSFLLLLRQKLQLVGGGEILAASLQKEIAEWFGFKDLKKFMGEVQKALESVSFYADWMIEKYQGSSKRLKQIESLTLKRLDAAFALLEDDPSVLVQERVRNELKTGQNASAEVSSKSWGKVLNKHFNPQTKDATLRAFFRSKLMGRVIPDLKRVTGLVQHDQYHRLTVETHTLQAVREVLRVKKTPRLLGRLAPQVKKLKTQDWSILLWSALYHDLGKGLAGDHSSVGSDIVKRDLTAFGLSLRETIEIAWMVKNHLLVSGAAFRQNPQAPTTWKWLFDHNLKGQRIGRLTIFTAIDIRATNIEAWNDWKERLLAELAETLSSPKAQKFEDLLEKTAQKNIKLEREFVEPLDPTLIEELPNKVLIEDYARLHKAKGDLEPLIVKGRKKNELWVRLHSRADRPGLFLNYVAKLFNLGAGVQEAFVQTYPKFGVYDWFRVKWSRSPAQARALFALVNATDNALPKVFFESVDLVRTEGDSAILSFRGRDQKGALVAASRALYEAGLSLRWARVHTWGQQIDDVFSVSGSVEWNKIVGELRQKFLPK